VILLVEHEETLLAAKKKRQHETSISLTSTPKNRVWVFENRPLGRLCSEPDLSWETAAGSVQYSYENVPGRAEFLSRDPLSGAEFSQGTNLYAYVGNNYLNASDPTGETTVSFGVSWNITIGPINVEGGFGFVADSSLGLGLYGTVGVSGAGPGPGGTGLDVSNVTGGGGGLDIGMGVQGGVTNAPTIDSLNGYSAAVGGEFGGGAQDTAEFIGGKDENGNPYGGESLSTGIGAGAGLWSGGQWTTVYNISNPQKTPPTPAPAKKSGCSGGGNGGGLPSQS